MNINRVNINKNKPKIVTEFTILLIVVRNVSYNFRFYPGPHMPFPQVAYFAEVSKISPLRLFTAVLLLPVLSDNY
jgi:hypothetical protein